MSAPRSEDGYWLDSWDREIGICNACDDEAYVGFDCCDDGEIVPPSWEDEE